MAKRRDPAREEGSHATHVRPEELIAKLREATCLLARARSSSPIKQVSTGKPRARLRICC
jgi:hypothetical protein